MIVWRDYQTEIIDAVFADWGKHQSVLAVAATGAGKAQPLDALILTPKGWVTMGDLTIGSEVIGSDGKTHKVMGVFPQGAKEVYRVHFDDSTFAECCKDHLWSVQTKCQKSRGKGFTVMPLEEIMQDGLTDGSGASKYFLPVVKPIDFEDRAIPLDPYVLGVLIGDGSLLAQKTKRKRGVAKREFKHRETKDQMLYSTRFSSEDQFVINEVTNRLIDFATVKHVANFDYAIHCGGKRGPVKSKMTAALCDLGLMGMHAWEKFVPDAYKYNSVNVRLQLLRGLMDTDGTISTKGDGKAPEFCTVSYRLAQDVCEIVRSLGGCTKVREKPVSQYTYKGETRTGRAVYRVTVSIPDCPFLLPRKAELYNYAPKQGRTKAITKIENVSVKDCQCILIDSPDHLYVTDGYTLTHNTNILWGIADRFLDERPGARVVVLAHRKELIEQPLARLGQFWPHLVDKAGVVMADQDDCHRQIIIATVQTLGAKSGKRLKELLRYGKVDLLVVDECFVAGTLVDGKPIETVKVGDNVTAWDETKGIFVDSKVTRLFKSKAPSKLISITADGKNIICTPNHPVFCNGKWIAAELVQSGDYMVQYIMSTQNSISSERDRNNVQDKPKAMRGVRKDVYAQELEPQYGSDVFAGMQSRSYGRQTKESDRVLRGVRYGSRMQGAARIGNGKTGDSLLFGGMQEQKNVSYLIRDNGENQPKVCQRTNEKEQSNERSGSKSQDANQDAHNWIQGGTRWQRRIDSATIGSSKCSELGDGSVDTYRSLSRWQWLSDLIQGRYWKRNSQGSNRDRWSKPQDASQARRRSKENRTPRIVRVDSVEILERGSDERFDRMCPDGFVYNLEVEKQHTYTANGLIVHNCHHARAAQYRTVIDRLKEHKPALKILGVTATPERGDKKSLAEIFEKEAANVGVLRLIEEGHLCEPRVHGVKTNIDLSGVTVQGSGGNRDYNQQQLVAAVETDDVFKLVVKTHIDKIMHRPTIAFVPSVAGAYKLAALLRDQGIQAVAADGTTPKAEREAVLSDFKAGRVTCICNVALWTEGLDLPNLECCHLVRPTKSDSLYLQMVGRVLRLHPGKLFADIYDYQPKDSRNLEQRMIKLGLKKPFPPIERIGGGGLGGVPKPKAGDQIEYVLLGYFAKRKEAWLDADGWRLVTLGKGSDGIDRSIAISPDGAQLWAVWREDGERWAKAKLYLQGTFDQVSAKAEEFIRKHGRQSLVNRDVRWRSRPPSEKQETFGRKLGVYNEDMSAGQLSDAINKKLIMQAIDRERKTASHRQAVLASVVSDLARPDLAIQA